MLAFYGGPDRNRVERVDAVDEDELNARIGSTGRLPRLGALGKECVEELMVIVE
jgi:hypothetical protein